LGERVFVDGSEVELLFNGDGLGWWMVEVVDERKKDQARRTGLYIIIPRSVLREGSHFTHVTPVS
jgi:hypothetical protein